MAVRLRGVVKRFGDTTAVAGVDLDVAPGEFFSMLGPSGSGKTTVLRMIAGFEAPTAGTVELAGVDVTHVPANRRDVHTVFQDYALFPHMSVVDNVAYGLRVRGVAKAERRKAAAEALEQVRLGATYGERRPDQLSGGQRQRVALARALVNRPQVLLLDEPLGALDLKLRVEMQEELKGIQRDVGITFLFVTHDQEEALSMSDRVAVFDAGRVVQVDPPAALYERPATTFVADFVGTSNLIRGEAASALLGRDGVHGIRPEKLWLAAPDTAPGPGESSAPGRVAEVVFAGSVTRIAVTLDAGPRLVVLRANSGVPEPVAAERGAAVRVCWRDDHVVSVDGAAGDPAQPT